MDREEAVRQLQEKLEQVKGIICEAFPEFTDARLSILHKNYLGIEVEKWEPHEKTDDYGSLKRRKLLSVSRSEYGWNNWADMDNEYYARLGILLDEKGEEKSA